MAVAAASEHVYSLSLGSSITSPTESNRYTSIRYNYKPRMRDLKRAAYSIKKTKHAFNSHTFTELILKDGKDEYQYSGKQVDDAELYVLLSKGNGNRKEMILEKLEACHEYNLVEAPSEEDPSRIKSRYPQLPEAQGVELELFGDTDPVDEAVDSSNPFDYRNYLKRDAPKPNNRNTEAPRSSATTTQATPRPASVTPQSKPVNRSNNAFISQKKRKTPDPAKANLKRVKAGSEPNLPAFSSRSNPRTDVPKVRMDRKASLQIPPFEDTGELILENETPVSEKPPKLASAMSLALSGQLGQGPISLRSAASSPASRMASPIPSRPDDIEEGEEFEFGNSSSPEEPSRGRANAFSSRAIVDEEDEDADADVEDFELPSPVQAHHKSIPAAATDANADDDDDLGKQLALAMAEDNDDDLPTGAPPPESDEESEEE